MGTWKYRFEEIIHEVNDLESPTEIRRKELAKCLARHTIENQDDICEPNEVLYTEDLIDNIYEMIYGINYDEKSKV